MSKKTKPKKKIRTMPLEPWSRKKKVALSTERESILAAHTSPRPIGGKKVLVGTGKKKSAKTVAG